MRLNACTVHIFLIFSDSWNPFTSNQFTWLHFLFWSFRSHLYSATSLLSSKILLSTALPHISGVSSFDFAPEGAGWLHHWTELQLIIESHFLGHPVPILCPPHLGHLNHSGHHVPLFLAFFSSTSSDDHLIISYNIFYLSLLDRYRDSLNPDSWGSSLVLGMILWLIIRSCAKSGILVCYFDSLELSFVLEIILKSSSCFILGI